MTLDPVSLFIQALKDHQLLPPAQLAEVEDLRRSFVEWPLLSSPVILRDLGQELLARGLITEYQLDRLLNGGAEELALGKYVLLGLLGEGGMGQVFKARHRGLDRVVAVKVIRRERLGDDAALQRFQREIRALAQLSHPNIVLAYDADQVGDRYFIAMEYVEGTDLGRLVRERGPLPVMQACAYVYQAARGLQHAHERGLVHRDLKPSNLIVAREGCPVKILDMGLARLTQAEGHQTTTGELTHDEAMMGTPDYMAPEQAVDSHGVDIRADLYGLGCTFYFLLTGSVPFPGGTALKKLFKHCWTEPVPVQALRPDVPPDVAAVVRRLMEKRPENRYQTPAEVAEIVSGFFPCGEAVLGPAPQQPDWYQQLLTEAEQRLRSSTTAADSADG